MEDSASEFSRLILDLGLSSLTSPFFFTIVTTTTPTAEDATLNPAAAVSEARRKLSFTWLGFSAPAYALCRDSYGGDRQQSGGGGGYGGNR